VRRRFVGLTALRWLPTGLITSVLVLVEQQRGLTLAEVGLVAGVQGVVIMLLELPTGGLADALGRRPVLLGASLLDLTSLVLLLRAGSVVAFMAAWAVQGVYRALESGPLEAWYVDASLAADPGTDIERGLAQAGTAIGLGLSAGALAAAGLVAWDPLAGIDPLAVPLVVALALRVVGIAALARWLVEDQWPARPAVAPAAAVSAPYPADTDADAATGNGARNDASAGVDARPGEGAGAEVGARPGTGAGTARDARIDILGGAGTGALAQVRAGVRDAVRVMGETVGLLRASPALVALVSIELFWGAGLTAVELLTAPRLVELLGDPDQGAVVFGLAVSLGWSVSAVGSALTARFTRLLGGGPARVGAVLRIVQGATALVLAVVGGAAGLLAGYLGFYLAHGTANVVHYGMVHRLVDGRRRTTVLSAHSLAARGAGAIAAASLGAVAAEHGPATALAIAAVLLAVAAPLYRIAGREDRPTVRQPDPPPAEAPRAASGAPLPGAPPTGSFASWDRRTSGGAPRAARPP